MQIRKGNYHYLSFLILLSVFIFFSASCSVNSLHVKQGMEYYNVGDFDKAVELLEKAFAENPKKSEIKTRLFRAKLKSYYTHLELARKYKDKKKKDEAIKEYKIALAIFPQNQRLEDEFKEFIGAKKPSHRKEFVSQIHPPVTLSVDSKKKIKSIKLTNTPIIQIFKILGKSYGVNFVFDKDFRDFVYTIEIENIGFYEVLNQLCMISNTQHRILDRSSVLIYQNTTFKKRTFDLRGVKAFYLSNIKAEDARKLVMAVFRDQQIQSQEDSSLNCVIVKGASNTLKEIEIFLNSIDKEKSEIEIDIQILEVNRNIIKEIGADFTTPLSSIAAGSVDAEGNVKSSLNFNELKDTNFYMTIPSVALSFLQSDENTKIISKPNLRGVHGEEINFVVGEERPIPQTQFQSVAAGGVNTVPMTTYQYKNVGVKIKITPFIHANNEVTLKLKLTTDFLSGMVNDFPIFGKRELESVIRLKEGETNIIGGFIKDEVRDSLNGYPFFSKIPIIGKLFGSTGKTIMQTDLIFSITPRIIRKMNLAPGDLDAVWLNSRIEGQGSGGKKDPKDPKERFQGPKKKPKNSVVIAPSVRKIPVNSYSIFTIRMMSEAKVNSISLNGSVAGSKTNIMELKTDFLKGSHVKVISNFSDSSFDLGYSFTNDGISNNIIGQLKVKFLEKGNYSISVDSVTAQTKDGTQVDFLTSPAEIEVY